MREKWLFLDIGEIERANFCPEFSEENRGSLHSSSVSFNFFKMLTRKQKLTLSSRRKSQFWKVQNMSLISNLHSNTKWRRECLKKVKRVLRHLTWHFCPLLSFSDMSCCYYCPDRYPAPRFLIARAPSIVCTLIVLVPRRVWSGLWYTEPQFSHSPLMIQIFFGSKKGKISRWQVPKPEYLMKIALKGNFFRCQATKMGIEGGGLGAKKQMIFG